MTPVNYDTMTDQEVKEYFLAHRDDQTAFYAHMDRVNARPQKDPIKPDDPDADEKFRLMVEEKLAQGQNKP
jgi:hypothetical protein